MPWSRRAASAAACALLAACGTSGTAAKGTAPVPTAPPTTSDPWAVPATITDSYIQQVLDRLNHADGEAVRSARAANAITAAFVQIQSDIRATDHERKLALALWTKTIADGWPHIDSTPGDRKSVLASVTIRTDKCIFASVHEDFSAQGSGGGNTFAQWFVGLIPVPSTPNNPTFWGFSYDGYEPDGSTPRAPCGTAT